MADGGERVSERVKGVKPAQARCKPTLFLVDLITSSCLMTTTFHIWTFAVDKGLPRFINKKYHLWTVLMASSLLLISFHADWTIFIWRNLVLLQTLTMFFLRDFFFQSKYIGRMCNIYKSRSQEEYKGTGLESEVFVDPSQNE